MKGNPTTFDHTKLSNIGTNTHAQIDTHVASTSNPHGTTKAQVGLANVDNTSDASKPVSTAQQTALNLKEDTANKNQNNGYAGLDGSGKINPSQLPAIAVTDTNVVASQVAMLALTAEVGDLAVRTDLNKTFILRVSPASTLGNWQELLTPTDQVTSIYGRTGVVTAQSGDYTADQITETASNKILTSAERTKLAGIATGATANSTDAQLRDRATHTGTQLANTISDFASTVLATVLTGLSLITNSAITATDTVLVALGKLQAQITSLGSTKQDTLVNQTNIKSINNQSLLGSGNITISGGGGATDLAYVASSTDGVVTSSTGNSATIPAGSVTNASLMLPADKTKLDSITVDTATVVRKLVRNQTGATIPKGTAVYQLGSSGIVMTVAPADASLEATASQTLGITQEAIANNTDGYVVAVGLLDGVNTSALTEGQIVWLSETAGQLTTTRPTQPAHGVVCGYCVKQGGGASGILYVKVDNGLELAELHDVLLTGAVTGNVLALFADGLWKPLALDKTSVGLGNLDNTSDANKPISTATQTALNAKQNTLVSATNIKTINGTSVLGSGDLEVTGSGGISNNQSIINALVFG